MINTRKTVLCEHNLYKTCYKGDRCAYAHDTDQILNSNHGTNICEKASIFDICIGHTFKVLLICMINIKYVSYEFKTDISNIFKLLSLHICVPEHGLAYGYGEDEYIMFINELLQYYSCNIEYIKCIIILCFNNNYILRNVLNMEHVTNDILKISLLSYAIKKNYATQLLEYLKYKKTYVNLYDFITKLNDDVLKKTTNSNEIWSDNKSITKLFQLKINDNIKKIKLIYSNKFFVIYLIKQYYTTNMYKTMPLPYDLKHNVDFIKHILHINGLIAIELDVRDYNNISIIQKILRFNPSGYHLLNNDLQNNKYIISDMCKTKNMYIIPIEKRVEIYVNYLISFRKMKKLGLNENVLRIIAWYIIPESDWQQKKYNKSVFRHINRKQELFVRRK